MAKFSELLKSDLPLTEQAIKAEFETLTAENGFITNTAEISPFWRLIKAIAITPVKWLTDTMLDKVLPQMFVQTASGQWLEMHAQMLGLERLSKRKAKGIMTFSKFNVANSLIIPAGTPIASPPINGKSYRLIVTTRTTIPAGIRSQGVAVEAEEAGAAYNLGEHYYTILNDDLSAHCEAFNAKEWLKVAGRDDENDDELKERYRLQFASQGAHHIDHVYRRLINEITGLSQDRIFFQHDAPRGPGTANVYLLLERGANVKEQIDNINKKLNEEGNHGHGDDVQAYELPTQAHNVTATLIFKHRDNLNEAETEEIRQQVIDVIRCAFRENQAYQVTKVSPFSRFSFSKLGEEIHQLFPQIRAILWEQADILSGLFIPTLGAVSVSIENEN